MNPRPPKDELQIPVLLLKAVKEGEKTTNNPQWISRALYLLVRMLKFEKIPPKALTMVHKISDESMKGVLLNMTNEEIKDDTPW